MTVVAVVESGLALAACLWYIDDTAEPHAATVVVPNGRDPNPLVTFAARGEGSCDDGAILYRVVDSVQGAAVVAERLERVRHVELVGETREHLASFVRRALARYKRDVLQRAKTPPAGTGDLSIPSWSFDHHGSSDDGDGAWTPDPAPASRRAMQTVHTHPPEAGAAVLEDLRRFLDASAEGWYARMGVARTRIYLLHGTVGSGKSTLARALASEIGWGLANVHGGCVVEASARVPASCMLVVDDADAVPRADMIRALDGLATGSVVLLLTNRSLGALDEAVRRRADVVVPFAHATEAQVRALWGRFSGDGELPEGAYAPGISMAVWEKLFVKCCRCREVPTPRSVRAAAEAAHGDPERSSMMYM
jgi:hypothetical protein